jgi:hypothetical protein
MHQAKVLSNLHLQQLEKFQVLFMMYQKYQKSSSQRAAWSHQSSLDPVQNLMHQPENEAKTLILQNHWDLQNASEKRKSVGSVLVLIVLEQCLKGYAKIHVHHVRIWAVKAEIVDIQVRSVRNC